MSSERYNNSGCLLPFGDDFLPILMFFLSSNQDYSSKSQLIKDNEDRDEEAGVQQEKR